MENQIERELTAVELNKIALENLQEQANIKADELTARYGKKVHPFLFFQNEGDAIEKIAVGYMKEPNRLDKLQAIDIAFQSPMRAGMRLLEMGLIKEESDHRYLNDDSAYDAINIGAYQKALTVVQYSTDLAKKKVV